MDINSLINYLESEEGQKQLDSFTKQQLIKKHILNFQLERFHNKITNQTVFSEFVEKVIKKYNSDWYYQNWIIKKGCEPPEYLYHFLFKYAEKYGREGTEKEILDEDNIFLTGMHFIHNYKFVRMDGQGCVIHIEKIT